MAWLDPAAVKLLMGSGLAAQADDEALQEVVEAAVAFVERKLEVVGDETWEPTPDVRVGAAMLAHRWYARRGSPLGVLGLTDAGASGILRSDPDIGRLLGIGSYGRFVFGAPPAATEVTA